MTTTTTTILPHGGALVDRVLDGPQRDEAHWPGFRAGGVGQQLLHRGIAGGLIAFVRYKRWL